MALTACQPQLRLMNIGMAQETIWIDLCEIIYLVALRTPHLDMLTLKFKIRSAVIKPDVRPALRRMTRIALEVH